MLLTQKVIPVCILVGKFIIKKRVKKRIPIFTTKLSGHLCSIHKPLKPIISTNS